MNFIVILSLGVTLVCVSDLVHGTHQSENPQDLFGNLGLDLNLEWAETAWDQTFGLEAEVAMDIMERITYNKYPAESHKTTTKDGYILQIHRIPSKDKSRIPVVVVHGTFTTAECWFANTRENNLPFVLSDSGEDVWLLNLRGCQNSLGHTTLDSGPFSQKYWAFSFDEIANYDMPACVDYILNATGHSQVYLIGHSLGGGLPIFMLAEKPEYNNKVKSIFALAPLGNLADFKHHLRWVAHFEDIYQILTKLTSLYELYLPLSKRAIGTIIKIYGFIYKLPLANHILIDAKNWNFTRAPNYFSTLFSSTSLQLIYHYDQFLRTNGAVGLRHYNWGEETNVLKYGVPNPPLYNLSAVTVPVHLYYGSDDNFISETNVRYFKDRLPNVVAFIEMGNWDHVDFIWAMDTKSRLFKPLADIIRNDN